MILNTWSGSNGLNQPSQTQNPFAAPADEAKRLKGGSKVSVVAEVKTMVSGATANNQQW